MATSTQCSCTFPQHFSSEDAVGTIRRLLRTEFLKTEDDTTYSRLHVCGSNPNLWRKVGPILRPLTPPTYKMLWVVRQRQEGKGPHWSLFCAFDDNTDSPKGRVWQVNGDPDVGMHYAHRGVETAIPMFLTASFTGKLLVSDQISKDSEAKIDEIANTIKPPGPDEGVVTRRSDGHQCNCTDWVWQVLEELVNEGIVTSEAAEEAKNLPDLEPFDE